MTYARLEVYWPDGRIETHMLSSPTVSIGRADGNTIPLDSDTISRYHFSITQSDDDDDEIVIADLESANGTYVDGSLLESNQPQPLGDVEEIQAGALRIIFRKLDDSPTMPMTSLDDTARMEREEAHLRIEFDINNINVWPAASGSSEMSITNTGSETQRYMINVSGLPSEWLRITRSEVELLAGETAYVLIHIKPPRRPTTKPATYVLTIEVAPADRPDLALQTTLEVNVRAYKGFGIAIAPQPDAGDPVSLYLHNQGSGEQQIQLKAIDPTKNLKFSLPTGTLKLDAGQRMRVDMEINAKNPPLVGSPASYPFLIEAKSLDKAGFVVVGEGKVAVAPRLRLWTAVSILGIILSLIVVIGLAALGVLNPPNPAFNTVSANANNIAYGDAIILSVDADDVDSMSVYVNDALVLEDVAGDSTRIELDSAELGAGTQMIQLVGETRGATAEATLTVTIYRPVTIDVFEVTPQPLVRNTVNTLQIEWDVPNAVQVQISGLSAFTNGLLQDSTPYAASDVLEGIGGIPTESLTLTLRAEDEVGNPITQTLNLPIIDPQCTALAEIALHEGPNENYRQVGLVPQGSTVIVTAQDADAGWLSVQLAGDVRGWGARDNFECLDTFNLSDLRTEYNVPNLPTITPVPTLVPTEAATEAVTPEVTPEVTESAD